MWRLLLFSCGGVLCSSSLSSSFSSSSISSSLGDLNLKRAPFPNITSTGSVSFSAQGATPSPCIVSGLTENYPNYFFFHAHIPKTDEGAMTQCFYQQWDRSHQQGIVQDRAVVGVTASSSRLYRCRDTSFPSLSKMKYLSCQIYGSGDLSATLFALNSNLPKGQKVLPFTLIRHPMEYIFSALNHHLVVRRGVACQNFHEILLSDSLASPDTDSDSDPDSDLDPSSTNQSHPARHCAHYDIQNLQTRALSHSFGRTPAAAPAPGVAESHYHGDLGSANLTDALLVLRNEMFFVGITSYFRASMCLFAAQLGQLHLHLSACNCNEMKPSPKSLKEEDVPMDPTQVMSAKEMAILRSKYINLDEVLYDYALDLFLTRVGIVERQSKVALLCDHTDGEAIMIRKRLLESQ
jgi:hypothetical protein